MFNNTPKSTNNNKRTLIKKCLNNFKTTLHLCSTNNKRQQQQHQEQSEQNYDYAPYVNERARNFYQDLHVNNSPALRFHAKPSRQSIEPIAVDQDSTFSISKFPLLINSPEPTHLHQSNKKKNILSSTHYCVKKSLDYEQQTLALSQINDYSMVNGVFTNMSYCSPCLNNSASPTTSTSSSSSSNEYYDLIAQHPISQAQVNPSFFVENELYVCCREHEARDNSEVSLQFTDRVKIIYDKGDMLLVQNVSNGQTGYVPINCICSMDQFFQNIKQLNNLELIN